MKRFRAVDVPPKFRRTAKGGRNTRLGDSVYFSRFFSAYNLVYLKFFLMWVCCIALDFLVGFRFELLWPVWLLVRHLYESFRVHAVSSSLHYSAFSVFFVCVTATSDLVCYLFIPIQVLIFLASTYVWVQFVYQSSDRGVCLPSLFLWALFIVFEYSVRYRFDNVTWYLTRTSWITAGLFPSTADSVSVGLSANSSSTSSPSSTRLELYRPFAAHCIGFPVVTLGFRVKSFFSNWRMRIRREEVMRQNEFFERLLADALPTSFDNRKHFISSRSHLSMDQLDVLDYDMATLALKQQQHHHHHQQNGTLIKQHQQRNNIAEQQHLTGTATTTTTMLQHHQQQNGTPLLVKQHQHQLQRNNVAEQQQQQQHYQQQQQFAGMTTSSHHQQNGTLVKQQQHHHHQQQRNNVVVVEQQHHHLMTGTTPAAAQEVGAVAVAAAADNCSSNSSNSSSSSSECSLLRENAQRLSEIRQLQKERQTLEVSVDKMKAELKNARQCEGELRVQLANAQQREQCSRDELKQFEREQKQRVDQLETKCKQLAKQNDYYKMNTQALERRVGELQLKKSEIERELSNERLRNLARDDAPPPPPPPSVTKQQQQLNADNGELKQKLASQDSELKTLRKDLKSKNEQFTKIEDQLRQVRITKSDGTKQMEQMRQKNFLLEQTLSSENKLKQDLFRALNDSKAEIATLKARLPPKQQLQQQAVSNNNNNNNTEVQQQQGGAGGGSGIAMLNIFRDATMNAGGGGGTTGTGNAAAGAAAPSSLWGPLWLNFDDLRADDFTPKDVNKKLCVRATTEEDEEK